MNSHCCPEMREQVNFQCDRHKDAFECPDALIAYTPRYDEYGLIIHDGGTSVRLISHCPWCGTKLPASRRNQWFDELESLGFDEPTAREVPEKYKTDAWYRVAGRPKPAIRNRCPTRSTNNLAMPTDSELASVVDDVMDFSRDDWVGLWVILGWVKERMPEANSDEQKAATLAVCAAVLSRGLKAGDTPYAPGGFQPWADQGASTVIAAISQQWARLDREPDIGDIVAFG